MEIVIHLHTKLAQAVCLELYHQHDYRTFPRRFFASGKDDFGLIFKVEVNLTSFNFRFEGIDSECAEERFYGNYLGKEVWCLSDWSEVYPVRPALVKGHVDEFYQKIESLIPEQLYLPETDIAYLREGIPPDHGERPGIKKSLLGANKLLDGSVCFGFFHPRAAQVYLVGNFNDWQCPGHSEPCLEKFYPFGLYRGYYDYPNLWVLHLPAELCSEKFEYLFFVVGGVPLNSNQYPWRYQHDPMVRCYDLDYTTNNCLVVDPTQYHWRCNTWQIPALAELIIYELNIYGFTEGDQDIPLLEQGRFAGLMRRIKAGYFEKLGVNALELMPTAEAPSMQGPTTMGYDPCGFAAIERDFGTPDELRELVDVAHQHGLVVIMDVVFNHTSNTFNPLWEAIIDRDPGGFYFSGSTPWGNRVATEREEVQNYLIDVCKLFLKEYRVDGFRFDATHSFWLCHNFLRRLQYEIRDRGFKADCILIAENMPNESDLNLQGWNGYAQWCDAFHDKLTALLREGIFQNWMDNSPEFLGEIFYYCRYFFAAHTNNVINFCESHDENSVQYEVGTDGPGLRSDAAKERKARLGLFAAMVALGQPMLYMGQEFGIERPRNHVQFAWPTNLEQHYFFQWTRGLIKLRRRYPGLRMSGSDLIGEGRFTFILAPWLETSQRRTVIGWRVNPTNQAEERLVVLLNFEPYEIEVGIDFGTPGNWVKLADIDQVNDLPPQGSNHVDLESTIHTSGYLPSFKLPSSSGFIYKWVN